MMGQLMKPKKTEITGVRHLNICILTNENLQSSLNHVLLISDKLRKEINKVILFSKRRLETRFVLTSPLISTTKSTCK